MIYNPFIPSVRFSSRAVFGGGGGGDPAPTPVVDPQIAIDAAAKVEADRVAALSAEDKLKEDQIKESEDSSASATQFAEDVTSDVSGSAKTSQATINKLQLELQQLQSNLKTQDSPEKEAEYAEKLLADPSFVRPPFTPNPAAEAAIKAKEAELSKAQGNRASIGGVQAQELMTAQAGLVTDVVTDPTKIVKEQDVVKIDADAAGTNLTEGTGKLDGKITTDVNNPGYTDRADKPKTVEASKYEASTSSEKVKEELEGGGGFDGDAMLESVDKTRLPRKMIGLKYNAETGTFEYQNRMAQTQITRPGEPDPEPQFETISLTPAELEEISGTSVEKFTSEKTGLSAAKGEVSEEAQATAQQGTLSVGAAATAFGVDDAFIKDIKAGKRKVTPEEIAEAAKRSGTPVAEIQKMLAPYKEVDAAKFEGDRPKAEAQDVYTLTPTQTAAQTATTVQDAARQSEYPTADAAKSDFQSTLKAAQSSVGGKELVDAEDIIGTAKAVQAVASTDKALNEASIAIAAQGSFSQAALAKAAQGSVPPSATVQGQMSDLMLQFDNGTPAWAAGAMRAANAAMAARGMGASSMASSAIVQAAMESAMPIASQDAQTFQQMNMTNLNNQQQVSLANAAAQQNMELANLSNRQQSALQNSSNSFALQSQNLSNTQAVVIANAQFKSALQNKTLDIKTQTSLANASKYAEMNQINLNNRQQSNLQRSSENLQVEMANLSNEQQASISNLQVRAALVGQELTNEQQVAVLESTQDFQKANFDASSKQQAFLQDAQANAALEGKSMDIRQQTQLFNVSSELEERKIELNNEQQTTLFNSTNKLNIDLAELSNRQQTALANAQIDAALTGQELTNQQQVNVLKTERFAEAANLTFTAEQTAVLHKSDLIKTISIAELSGKNAAALQNAAAVASMDTTNLNARQQAEVLNAQSFLAMDMANLSNEQQTSIFKAQAIQQSLLSDTAAENASKQFNASSENQTNQFMASIKTQVDQFNSTQTNAMNQFNAGETNAMSKFNSEMKNQREQFNSQNALVVAQANALWRQNTGTINTAAQNTANATAAATANGYTASVVDQVWQRERDMMAFAFQGADNEQERMTRLLLGDKDLEEVRIQMEAGAEAAKKKAQGELWGKVVGCCFIMLEARYGDGTMDKVVRQYRDEYMTDRNRRGYYKLAEVLVPLMRRSKVVKWLVVKTFADPLVSYGKYHYGQNKHGVLYSPIKSFWMGVFDILGGETEFIRENGEVV